MILECISAEAVVDQKRQLQSFIPARVSDNYQTMNSVLLTINFGWQSDLCANKLNMIVLSV